MKGLLKKYIYLVLLTSMASSLAALNHCEHSAVGIYRFDALVLSCQVFENDNLVRSYSWSDIMRYGDYPHIHKIITTDDGRDYRLNIERRRENYSFYVDFYLNTLDYGLKGQRAFDVLCPAEPEKKEREIDLNFYSQQARSTMRIKCQISDRENSWYEKLFPGIF
jgi:hypothetical protein